MLSKTIQSLIQSFVNFRTQIMIIKKDGVDRPKKNILEKKMGRKENEKGNIPVQVNTSWLHAILHVMLIK